MGGSSQERRKDEEREGQHREIKTRWAILRKIHVKTEQRTLEPYLSNEEKRIPTLNNWRGKAAAVGSTPKVFQNVCLFTWLLQRLSSRTAKAKTTG